MPAHKRRGSRALLSDLSDQLKEYKKELKDIAEVHSDFPGFLKWFNHHDEFYSIVNLKKGKITWSHGIRTWLGHDTGSRSALKMDFISQLVHPFARYWYMTYQNAAFLVMARHSTALKELEYRFVITIPIRKEDNTYVMVKQMSMPYEYDKNNRVVTFLNSYTLVSKFQYTPLKLEFFRVAEKLEGKWMEDFHQYIQSRIKILRIHALPSHLLGVFREVRNGFKSEKQGENGKGIVGIRVDQLSSASVRKYKNQLKNWLIRLMLTPGSEREIRRFFPSDIPFDEVFNYFETSGIMSYLEGNMNM